MAGILLSGLDWFDFCEGERGVIAWGVAAGPKKRAQVHVHYASRQKADFVQAVTFELVVELLLGKSHRLAVYNALAGIDRFGRHLVSSSIPG